VRNQKQKTNGDVLLTLTVSAFDEAGAFVKPTVVFQLMGENEVCFVARAGEVSMLTK
jgi:hypothetical protein